MSEPSGLGLALKAASALLGYPSAALQDEAWRIGALLTERAELDAADRAAIEALASALAEDDLLELEASYCETFDRGRKVSLHLFEHVYGESRDRGAAMVELSRVYHDHGLAPDAGELPDYLPMFLEFCALLPPEAALGWLEEVGAVLQQLHVRLERRASPYAAVIRALLRLASLEPWPEELVEAAAQERRDDTRAALDATWQEAPVTFGPVPPRPRGNAAIGAGRPEAEPLTWVDFHDDGRSAAGAGTGGTERAR